MIDISKTILTIETKYLKKYNISKTLLFESENKYDKKPNSINCHDDIFVVELFSFILQQSC